MEKPTVDGRVEYSSFWRQGGQGEPISTVIRGKLGMYEPSFG